MNIWYYYNIMWLKTKVIHEHVIGKKIFVTVQFNSYEKICTNDNA